MARISRPLAREDSAYRHVPFIYLLSTRRSTAEHIHELILRDTTKASNAIAQIIRSPTSDTILREEVLEEQERCFSVFHITPGRPWSDQALYNQIKDGY